MPRLFTLPEAEAMLPEVEQWLRAALDSRQNASRFEQEINTLLVRVSLIGGMQVDVSAAATIKSGKEQSLERLRRSLQEIENAGCVVKDLDIGLVDFPTMLDGQEVYLCWKLGEPRIGFWHHTAEGFAGRKTIDRDFLARHRGGRPQ